MRYSVLLLIYFVLQRTSTTAIDKLSFNSAIKSSTEKLNNSTRPSLEVIEDEVDQQLFKSSGTIKRERDSKL